MRSTGFRAAGVSASVIFCMLLSACAAPRHRPEPAASSPTGESGHPAAPTPPPPKLPVVEKTDLIELSPWPRLRSRFVLDSCNYSGAVVKEARSYTRGPGIFTNSLVEAMPFLLLVVDELERRDLPGEFALLPYVESHYRPLPAKGRGGAGMWQLIGRTASAQGLQVSKTLDQRLDAVASTRVALDLIERYDREFGDWRLATMAFNAGEFRVKRQLGERSAAPMSSKELAALKLSPTTHRHLTRLLALACIVEQPENFGIDLPEPEETDFLRLLTFESAIDVRIAANLLGMPFGELSRINAQWRASPENIGPVSSLLVPGAAVTEFEQGLQLIPEDQRADWHQKRLGQDDTLASLASSANLSIQALAKANGLRTDVDISMGATVLIPGLDPNAHSPQNPAIHVVSQGDTLLAIAHAYGVKLAQLLSWNNLDRNSILNLGMQLRIRAPKY